MSNLRIARLRSASGARLLLRLRQRGRRVIDRRVDSDAAKVVREVRMGGDVALLEWVKRLDGAAPESADGLRVDPVMEAQSEELPPGFAAAVDHAIAKVEAFHRPQVVPGYRLEESGVELVERRQPLRRVGIYVPGGRAAYPSTVVMTAVPARLAGVEEIVVATPPRAWRESAALRHTLVRLGIRELWSVGGAPAIAALAYGTETLRPVDKIVGPGNSWVTAAKRRVANDVAVDGTAGPSEVVIFASEAAPVEIIAGDLLAQAEHDPRATAILITTSLPLARSVAAEIDAQLGDLPTASTARAALGALGAAFVVADAEEALAVIESLAPEHLQLVGKDAEALSDRVRNAGAIFVGAATGEVFGDYVAGPSHVLPTCGSARFASGLGVEDFVRRSHVVRMTPDAAKACAEIAAIMADVEGLPAHARAARRRNL